MDWWYLCCMKCEKNVATLEILLQWKVCLPGTVISHSMYPMLLLTHSHTTMQSCSLSAMRGLLCLYSSIFSCQLWGCWGEMCRFISMASEGSLFPSQSSDLFWPLCLFFDNMMCHVQVYENLFGERRREDVTLYRQLVGADLADRLLLFLQ